MMHMSQNSSPLSIADALVQLSFLIQGILVREAAAHDLSLVQMRLLGILRDRNPGMLELAQYLSLDDRAERRGLVQRMTIPEDGRVIRVSATAHGRQITAEISDQVEHEINRLVAGLSEADKQQFTAIAARLFNI